MAFSTIATRLPSEDERALEFVMKQEHLDKSSAVRKIIEIGLTEWKKREALRLYSEGRLTVSASAIFAGVPLMEWLGLLKDQKLPRIDFSEEDIASDLKALR